MKIDAHLALAGDMQFGLSGPWDCHVYAVGGPAGVVLIDSGAGTDGPRIVDNLRHDFGASTVSAVLLTHAHPDHCGGASWFHDKFACEILAPEPSARIVESGDETASGLAAARRSGVYPSDFHLTPCPVAHRLTHGEEFECGGMTWKSLHVPGHSADSFCYLATIGGRRTLFTGDVVFYGGVLGVVNAETSGMDGYRRYLQRLENLQVEALLPGHGMFTLRGGQRHIDIAIAETAKNAMPRQIGQGALIF